MKKILGHKKILNFFEKLIREDRLSHAYLFTGPEHVGKKTVAEYLATLILSVPLEKLKSEADYFYINREKNLKTKKINKDITVGQIRKLKNFLSQSSFKKDSYKIIIIDNAELLNKSASNSLLKILEEPNKKTIFFLVVQDETLLLDTIKSRCQIINFSLVNNDDLEGFLPDNLLVNYDGLVGEFINMQEDQDKKNFYIQEKKRFKDLFDKSFSEKKELIEDLFIDKSDHILAREKIHQILKIWFVELHFLIKKNNFLDKGELKNILKVEREIKIAQDLINQNVHPRLLLENIILEIP